MAEELAEIDGFALLHCNNCDLRFFEPLVTGGEAFYGALQDLSWYYQADKPEFSVAVEHLSSARRVLEVGSGRGAFAAHLTPGTAYTGLEFSSKAVRTARSAGLDVRQESVLDHALVEVAGYDAVVCFQVLEHVADVEPFLRACIACLRPGGTLVISVPSEDGFMGRVGNNTFNMPPHHVTRWTDRCLASVAKQFHVELIGLVHDDLGAEHRMVVANHLVESALGLGPQKGRLVRLDRRQRVLQRATDLAARTVARALVNKRLAPKGHSVTAIYRAAMAPSGTS